MAFSQVGGGRGAQGKKDIFTISRMETKIATKLVPALTPTDGFQNYEGN